MKRKHIWFSLLMAASAAFALAQPFSDQEMKAEFYADLGPDSIDVARYPNEQQWNYKVFVEKFSKCHTLARAINSPVAGEAAWDYYVMKMRRWMEPQHKARYSLQEAREIVAFLAFDSKERKIERLDDFDRLTRRLQLRFKDSIDERMRRLQKPSR